ncbi:MAG TPA: CusA/CzcA family heavy metal efflux RND transporter, partial [Flavobacteriales bacterium]|nr:CusA/CzcA family heavy metal efflux RND transporter [Flavobacteriales bacterium]
MITIVFKDHVPTLDARQHVSERLVMAAKEIPTAYGTPVLMPPTTGLGEIFQYTLTVDSAHRGQYDAMELRTIQDWILRRQLLGVPGVVDVSSFGGKTKQYEVAVDPTKLMSMSLTLVDVFNTLAANNANTGGSYIEKGPNVYSIRGEGLVTSLDQIADLAVRTTDGIPVRIRDVAQVRYGFAPRFGAMSRNAQGETVGAVVLMTKGENAVHVIDAVHERIAKVEKSLPEGVHVDVFVDRSKLIARTTATVEENLSMGALIVVLVLVLVLGNWRAGLIVASLIPLSLLFAIGMMQLFGQSANLMSLGALDFGLIVDGAVIVVEGTLFLLHTTYANRTLSRASMDKEVIGTSSRIMRSAVFGQVIILIVYVPIFALTGIEGKMFKPMALTVSFAIIGALLLSLTYVPLMGALFLDRKVKAHETLSDRLVARLHRLVEPLLKRALKRTGLVISASIALLIGAVLLFNTLGGEFIPELDEGDFAINYTIRQGSSLQHTMAVGKQLESIMQKEFPEVIEAVSKVGSSEIPTDPMPIESADMIVMLKDHAEWTSAKGKEELAERMNEKLSAIPGVNLSFEQPIQMRFNELIAGVKSDLAIKIYGDDLDLLFKKANEAATLIGTVEGAEDIKVEQVTGMPQLVVRPNRTRLSQYGVTIAELNRILNTALAGGRAGVVYEGEKRFDLIVRLANYRDADVDKVKDIRVPLPNGSQVPISDLAMVEFVSAPAQVTREDGERRIVVEANVRGRDIQSVAMDIDRTLTAKLQLPSGYYIEYGGTFKNLQEAKARLGVALPVALLLILILLFLAFGSFREALIIFSAVPLAAVGGVLALWVRGMSFSISAGIGFIALFGVAVLNGIVLISYFNREEEEGDTDITHRILRGVKERLRPVLATAAVASLGFLPMAFNTSIGSEVQRPLATVVIGGLITSTLLTLFVLPVLYKRFGSGRKRKKGGSGKSPAVALSIGLLLLIGGSANAQAPMLSLDSAVSRAVRTHPAMTAAELAVQEQEALRKTAFNLAPINVQYMQGQIQGPYRSDINVQATTGFAFPTTVLRRGDYLKETLRLAQNEKFGTSAYVKESAGGAYLQWAMGLEQVRMLQQLDSAYSSMAVFAARRFELGETGRLEKTSAQSRAEQVKVRLRQAQADLQAYQAEVERWTGALSGAMPMPEELLNIARAPDPSGGNDPLLLSM